MATTPTPTPGPAMGSSAEQLRFQQPAGYMNGKGGGQHGPPRSDRDPTQQHRNSTKVPESVPYQGQKLRHREYVDEQGYVMKQKKSRRHQLAKHVAAHLAVCLCCAWVCTAPCCCGV